MSDARAHAGGLRGALGVGAVAAALAALAMAGWAPYLAAEIQLRQHGALVGPAPRLPVQGRWFDDYFVVEPIDADTFAIGEPRYYQGNYSYLVVGTDRALLFDAGTGNRDIVPVVRSLTRLPVTVLPSHLHFDHVGALGRFDRTALLDTAALRSRARAGQLELQRYEFLGLADSLAAPRFKVDEWWPAGKRIELGGRTVQLLATPGHTPTSVALLDADRRLLFAGDFIYPGELYAFLPGASRSAYLATTRQLLATLDPATRIYCAHMADAPEAIAAPLLGVADLHALESTLVAIDRGEAKSSGFYPRVFPVRGPISFATGFAWNNR
ncbi:MAG: MBL fold metallo-hydrolase [Proteobacteria bacterium]|nr:MBL fold metallo-hydrolase [Pseudomonadota bacterium]